MTPSDRAPACERRHLESGDTSRGGDASILERRDGSVVAIEVKSSASASSGDFRGLRHLRDKLGDRFKAGAVLYTGPSTVPFGDRLAAIPISGLWAEMP